MYDADYEEFQRQQAEYKETGRYTEYVDEFTVVTHDQRPGLIKWTTKDSGKKAEYGDGMVRDTTEGKPQFPLLFPKGVPYEDQLITRVAELYQRGGEKYGARNWEKSSTEESLAHHEDALMRHVIKFLIGVEDGEDHAAAVVWNVNAVDLTRRKIQEKLEVVAEDSAYVEKKLLRLSDVVLSFTAGDKLLDKDQYLWVLDGEGWNAAQFSVPTPAPALSLAYMLDNYGPLRVHTGEFAGVTLLKDGSLKWGQ